MNWLKRKRHRESVPAVLYTEILGHGEETIVFIPGLGGTTRYWRSRVKQLEERYRIVFVDLLGFGHSPKPWTTYSVERQVQELHTVLRPLGKLTLVGHSLGALITVAYCARHPACIKRIVLLGMPYFGSQRNAYRYMRHGPVKGGYVFTNVVLTMVACIITRRLLGRVLPYVVRDVPREVAEDLVKHTWRSSTSSLWEVVYRYDAATDLRRVPDRITVVFIHGELDFMAPVTTIEQLVATHPGWQLHKLPTVDHHPFLRKPDICLSLITANEDSQ
jgi:pimeloyl-ACP methyl ester carboxylesterase